MVYSNDMRKRVSNVVRKHIGYVRVSSFAQILSGVSLEDQEQRLSADAAVRGVILDEIVHDDGRSGASLRRRPGMQRVLAMIERGEVASIAVVKIDRAFRSLSDMASSVTMMQKHHCELVSLSDRIDTSTAVGKMMLNMLGTFAQFERDLGSERTADGLAQKRSQGKVYSKQIPYGFRADGKSLVFDRETQAVLKRVLALSEDGTGPTAIARVLNLDGIASPGGKAWYASSVASVLATAQRKQALTPIALG